MNSAELKERIKRIQEYQLPKEAPDVDELLPETMGELCRLLRSVGKMSIQGLMELMQQDRRPALKLAACRTILDAIFKIDDRYLLVKQLDEMEKECREIAERYSADERKQVAS